MCSIFAYCSFVIQYCDLYLCFYWCHLLDKFVFDLLYSRVILLLTVVVLAGVVVFRAFLSAGYRHYYFSYRRRPGGGGIIL
jgi:hypothetical protein